MIVTLKPPGREEFALSLETVPVFSSVKEGGYESAQIACELDDEQRLSALGGRLRIHGQTGIVWQGIVTKRPGRGEPLIALGWGWCATLGRREALFCDTSANAWDERTWDGRNPRLMYSVQATAAGAPYLRFAMEDSVATGTASTGCWRRIPLTGGSRVVFDWSRPNNTFRLRLYYGTYGTGPTSDGTEIGGSWTQAWEQASGSGNLTGSETVDIDASHDSLLLYVQAENTYTPSGAKAIYFSGLKVYGVDDLTTCQTSTVFTNVIDTEIDTDYLPAGAAYRAWIATETTAVEPLIFESCDAVTKLSELTRYAAMDYGWFMEMVAGAPYCVPHWTARPTTPDYIIKLDEAEGYDIDESALDELVSVMRVNYTQVDGLAVHTDVVDTDTTHPLVALGITRYGDVSVQTASATTATAIGTIALSDQGRAQVKGSVTTRTVHSATGAEVYLPDVRPGKMVRVMGGSLTDGQRDCIVRRVTCTGDTIATVELDNEPYTLALALARLEKNDDPRRAQVQRAPRDHRRPRSNG